MQNNNKNQLILIEGDKIHINKVLNLGLFKKNFQACTVNYILSVTNTCSWAIIIHM